MKRILALILVLLLIVTAVPIRASAAQGGKLVALTFDDGPDYYDTDRLLDGLKERDVNVTFFMLGANAKANMHLVERAYEDGHEIASHSWDHPELTSLSDSQIHWQFDETAKVLDQVCGEGTEYLVRPPYGSTNQRVRDAIDSPLIHWSVDTLDWQLLNSYDVRDVILREAFDGGIILLHDIHSTSVSGALMAIDILLDWGYEFVTVSELYRRRGVEMENHEWHYMCRPNGTDLGPIPTPVITYTTNRKTMEITITADTDAPIYYTTDGSVPNGESTLYTGPFTVPYPCDIRAVAAYKLNGSRSDTAILAFGKTPCSAPQIQVEDMTLTITHDAQDVDIYYTLDGTPATTQSTLYTGPVKLEGECCIRAIAGGGFYQMSRETVRYCSVNSRLYADVKPTDWYFDPIDRLVSMGIMHGVGNDCFNPNGKLTRGMLVALLYRCSGEDLGDEWEKTNTFGDVKDSAYYAEAVEWAYRNGIVNGYSAQVFRPDGNITREEMCRVIDGYLTHKGNPLPAGESCKPLFADYNKIARWALPSVEAMVGVGLIMGDGVRMNPKGHATRAEVASVLVRMMDYQESYVPTPETPEPTPEPSEPAAPETP